MSATSSLMAADHLGTLGTLLSAPRGTLLTGTLRSGTLCSGTLRSGTLVTPNGTLRAPRGTLRSGTLISARGTL